MRGGREQHLPVVLARQPPGEVEPVLVEFELAQHLLPEGVAVRQAPSVGHPVLADDHDVGARPALLDLRERRHRLRKAAIGLHAPRHVGDQLVHVGEVEAGQLQAPARRRREVAGVHPVMLHGQLAAQQLGELRRLVPGRDDAPVARGEVEQDGGVAAPDPVLVVPRHVLAEEPDVPPLGVVIPLEVADVLRVRPDVPDVQARPPAGMRHDQVGRVARLLHLPPGPRQRLPVEDRALDEGEVGVLLLADLAVGTVAHHPQPVRRRSLPPGAEGHVVAPVRHVPGDGAELGGKIVV